MTMYWFDFDDDNQLDDDSYDSDQSMRCDSLTLPDDRCSAHLFLMMP